MTTGHSDYIHGEMAVDGHDKTFLGFAKTSAFCAALLVVLLLMPILVFTVHLAWVPALIITFIVGVLIKSPFKLGGSWYGVLIGLAVLAVVVGVFSSVIASMIAG